MSDKARFRFRSMNLVLGLAVLAGSLAFLAGDVGAASMTLYVRKATLTPLVEGGKVYAPVTELLRAMTFQWTPSGEGYELSPGSAGGPDIKSRHVVFTYKGKPCPTDTLIRGGKVWVQVKPLAEAVGALYIETLGSGIAQVSFPPGQLTEKDIARAVKEAGRRPSIEAKPLVTADKPADKPADNAADKPGDKAVDKPGDKTAEKTADPASKEDEKDPLEAKVEYTNPAIPGAKNPAEVRGTFTVKNSSDQVVKNVKVTVNFNDQSDQSVQTIPTEFFSQIDAGASVSKDFMWYNYNNYMNLKTKVEMTHDPLPKKKKDDKKADGKEEKKDEGATPSPK